jgi:hypothetical protein
VLSRPAWLFGAGLVLLVLWPIYARQPPGPLSTFAGVDLLALSAFAAVVRREARLTRLTVIDMALGAVLGLMTLSVIAGARTPADYVNLALRWAGPYLAARLLVGQIIPPRRFLAAVAGLALLTLPFAVYEVAAHDNPFFGLAHPGPLADIWASFDPRAGKFRVETSFGHPLAYAFFLAEAGLSAVILALTASERRERRAWTVGSACLAAALFLPVSRTGWLILGLGIVMVVLKLRSASQSRSPRRRLRIAAVSAAAAAVLGLLVVAPSFSGTGPFAVFGSSPGEVANTALRTSLVREAFDPGTLHALGNVDSRISQTVGDHTASIDDEYVYFADAWGYVPLVGLLAVAIALAVCAIRVPGIGGAVAAIGLASSVGLVALALITQQESFYWLFAGAASALAASRESASAFATTTSQDSSETTR